MRAIDRPFSLRGRLVLGLATAGTLAALGGPAAAQDKPHTARPPLPGEGAVMKQWREEPGRNANQRTFVSPDGNSRRGIASTTPRFDPATGRELSKDLTISAAGDEYVASHGDGSVGIPMHTDGAGARLTFGDGATVRVSASTRLFQRREDGRSWSLSARAAAGRLAGTDSVEFPGVFENARLIQAARPGGLETRLVLERLPEPLAGLGKADAAGPVFFEEELLLPAGWTVYGLPADDGRREFRATTQRVVLIDAQGVERAAIEAPKVYEELSPKGTPGRDAPAFAEIRQSGDRLTYRVGIPAAWLTDAARSFPVVIDPTLTRNVPITVSVDPTSITVSPLQVFWNAVAVSAAPGTSSTDWDLDMGAAFSWGFPPDCDFLVANGNKGTISQVTGEVSRFTGTGSATVEQAGIDSITAGTGATYAWTSTHVVHVWEINVTTAGTRQLTVNGVTGLRFAIYRPGTDSAWRSRSMRDYEFAVGATAQSINFNETGYWCLVAFKDGGPGASGTLSFTWPGSSTFNIAATSCTLDGPTFPVSVQPGGMFSFTRNIVQTGTLPAGAQIDYGVYLSTNTIISPADYEVWSFQGAGTGVLQLTGFVPATIPAGTYYCGMYITPVTGESSTVDNEAYDAAANHRVVVAQAPPAALTLAVNQPQTAANTPQAVNFTPGANAWNIVAVNGNDWNLAVGAANANRTGADTDFVVANGHRGAITPATGTLTRASGTGSASVEHDTAQAAVAGTNISASFGAAELVKVFDIDVTATGTQTLTVSGITGVRCALFAPGTDASWRARSGAVQEFAMGAATQVNFTAAGNWALIIFRENATAPSAGTVQVTWTPPPAQYNVTAAVVLSGATFPVTIAQGGTFDADRNITQTGTLPAAAQINYTVYLSIDANITAQDIAVYNFVGAAPGAFPVPCQVPATAAAGTYFVGLIIAPIAGESNAADNIAVDSAATHRVVITQVQTVALVQGTPAAATSTPTNFTLTPQASAWNLVAVGSTSDWDIEIGNAFSVKLNGDCDFVIADGNAGAIATPVAGKVTRYAGTANATVEHAAKSAITVGTNGTAQWTNTHIAHVVELTAAQAGTPSLTLAAPAGLRAALFPPQTTAGWFERALATQDFAIGAAATTLNLTSAGKWALVLFRDNGPGGTSGAVTFTWGTTPVPTFNLAATSATLQGAAFPLNLQSGAAFSVAYAWTQSGTLPAGAQLGLKVYLSVDNVIDASDFQAASIAGLTAGGGTAAATVPLTVPAGTYFAGIILDPIAGETSTTDNASVDAAATHRVVVTSSTPSGLTLVQGTPAQATATPTTFTLTPQAGAWNLVAVGSTDDWDIEIGNAMSLELNGDCDFLLADGNAGAIAAPVAGQVVRYAGAANATVEHAAKSAISVGTAGTVQWTNTHIAHVVELTVAQAGTPSLTLAAPAGLRAALFPPQTTAGWFERALAAQDFAVGTTATTLNLTGAGKWALVLFRDNGPGGTSGAVTFTWGTTPTPTFNLAATSATIQGLVFPQSLNRGDAFRVGYAWSQTGTPPVGAQLGLKVYLSVDNVIDTTDIQAASITGLTVGGGIADATVPAAIPAGTYFAGIILNPLAGETSTTDNAAVDAAATHRIIVSGGGSTTGFDLSASIIGVPAGVSVAAGQTFQVSRTIANLGGQASPIYAYAIYLSADATITPATDIKVFESAGAPSIAASQFDTASVTVTVPPSVAAGTYHVGLHVVQLPNDADATNDTAVATETIVVAAAGGGQTGGGVTTGRNIKRSGGGGGGGCAIGAPEASSPESAAGTLLPLLALAAALVVLRRRSAA